MSQLATAAGLFIGSLGGGGAISIAPQPLVITTQTLPAGMVGSSYTTTLSASGGTPPYTWSLESVVGLNTYTLSSSGVLMSTLLTTAGTNNAKVLVSDPLGASKEFTFPITVQSAPSVSITTTSLPNYTLGGAGYSAQLAATGGVGTITFAQTAHTGSNTYTVASNGAVTGSPTNADTDSITVVATDSEGNQSTPVTLSIVVAATLTIATTQLNAATAGSAYSSPLVATGGTPGYTFSITGSTGSNTYTISGSNIVGNPTHFDTDTVTVEVTDSASNTYSHTFTIAVGTTLAITTASLLSATVGQAYSAQLASSGGTGGNVWTLSAAGGGSPEVVGTSTTSQTSANLTALGSTDWIHWGDTTATAVNRKTGVTAAFSNYTVVGTGTINTYTNDLRPLTWTDGTPTASETSDTSGVYSANGVVGNGFSFTVPAGTTAQKLSLFVGGWNSAGTLTATLSDGSAGPYTITTSNVATQYDENFTIVYQAASAGQTLTVSWVQAGGSGNVTLNGAALSPVSTSANNWSVSSSGKLTGTPTVAETDALTFTLADSSGASKSATLSLVVKAAVAISINTTLPGGTVGTAYTQTLTESGGTGPFTWSIISQANTNKYTLTTSGVLTGTLTVAETDTLVVQVQDATGATAQATLSIAVSAATTSGFSITSTPTAATVGQAYAFQFAASGGTPPYTFSRVTSNPATQAWSTVNEWSFTPMSQTTGRTVPNTGVLYSIGVPVCNETAVVVIQCTDSAGNTTSNHFSIPVTGVQFNNPIELGPTGIGNAFSYVMTASGGSGNYTFSKASSTGANTWNVASNGTVTGTPGTIETSGLMITVTDTTTGKSLTQQFYISCVTAMTATRPSGNTGSGFFVRYGEVYDPTGKLFRIKGGNRVHYDSNPQPAFQKTTANTARVASYVTTGSISASTYAAGIQSEHIAYGEVPIFTMFDFPTGNQTTNNSSVTDFQSGITWWANNVGAFSSIMNQIMINLANEWGSNTQAWANAVIAGVESLRTAGWTCPFVIDAGGYDGQDYTSFTNYAAQIFAADTQKNLIFSMHCYEINEDVYVTLAMLNTAFGAMNSLRNSTGAAFIVGEFGNGYGSDNPPVWESPGQVMTVAHSYGLGHIPWGFDDGGSSNDNGGFAWMYSNDTYNAQSSLTIFGQDIVLNPYYGIKANSKLASGL